MECPSCQNELTLIKESNQAICYNEGCNFMKYITPEDMARIDNNEESIQKEEPVKPQPLPSMFNQAVNFTKAVSKHIISGAKKVPDSIYRKRMDICSGCEYLSIDKSQETRGRCAKCGCFVDLKASWASEECPIKKWGAYKGEGGGCNCGKK